MKTELYKLFLFLMLGLGWNAQGLAQTPSVNDGSPAPAATVEAAPSHQAEQLVGPLPTRLSEDSQAQPATSAVQIVEEAPPAPHLRQNALSISQISPALSNKLYGIHNARVLEFTLRHDQVVESAALDLVFTPSPALISRLSHIRVYLNDELMGIADTDNEFPGQQIQRVIPLNPLLMTRFNRVRLEFVGHYTDICEDPAHSSLWIDISQQTKVRINERMLTLANDLSFFPEPFFDSGDMSPQEIPFFFSNAPNPDTMRAAAILASYFGVQAKWRNLTHPVRYGEVFPSHGIVMATNDDRPEFLRHYPVVDAPTVEIIANPKSSQHKVLLVLGRDAEDLVTAASALAIGNKVFRGRSVTIDHLETVRPRKPYDAPNWVSTERAVYFSELIDFPGQLEVSGLMPRPIQLQINLPPDLFVWRNTGIPLHVLYRYVAPRTVNESRLTLSLNDRYIDSYPLQTSDERGAFTNLRLPLRGLDSSRSDEHLHLPALKVGSQNDIRFDFSFASVIGGAQQGLCQTTLPIDIRASISQDSSIDFSGFHHYLAMPNLRAFAGSGFPFSRMADLSQTIAVVPQNPTPLQTATFLETIGDLGAQIGYPALSLRVTDDWAIASSADADILLLGEMPAAMRSRPDGNLLLENTRVTLKQPRTAQRVLNKGNDDYRQHDASKREVLAEVSVRALAPMAAIVGMESETHPGRSIVGLLASTDEDYRLLRGALASSGKRDVMEGSVVLIRESGVYSEHVGPVYYVGKLPWWEKVWYYFADRPILVAVIAGLLIILIAVVLWNLLRLVSRRRLERDV